MGIYCAGKAARDIFHKTLAEENKADNNMYVLSYAPGPLDTDMTRRLKTGTHMDNDTKEMFQTMTYVDIGASAAKMCSLLRSRAYASGSHVDYFDDDVPKSTMESV
jgi:sepiapterin reductase